MREKDGILYQKPQVNLARPTAGRMWLVSLCAGMAILQSALTDSFASLVVALTVTAAAVLTELLISYKSVRMAALKDGSAVASALVLSLMLPNHIHPVYAALGACFAMAVVKHSFGGLGSNWLNPAIGGWLFIRLSWSSAFNNALTASPLSALTESLKRGFSTPQGSPLGLLKIDGNGFFAGGSPLDAAVRNLLNNTIFSITGAELPGGYIDLFVSSAEGIIADRGLGALLLGAVIITASQVSRSWIPAVYLGAYGVFIRIFGALPFGGNFGGGDILFGFLSGGTMAAAFLLTADPATGAKSVPGVLVVSLLAGILSYLFRYLGAEPYGAFYAVALLNAALPLIRRIESRKFYEKRRPL
jgi:electron transport complex protein RnfD